MKRGLALVSAGLAFFLLLLLGIVFFTRDEDNFQADNLLAEDFTLAVSQAAEEGGRLELRTVASFPYDRVLLVQPGTPREAISRELGREWTGIDTVDGGDLLIFLRDDEVVRFADYRGTGRFEGFERPFDELPAELAVDAGRVIRPG
ncbi:hypothetical protein OJ997_02765 [Solirubrobacter phytolaccae]|uniref:Uncharacterized protein n=1 Tax=Solirubrobacter phytolaccae TaxID=1404360 RepID=A0A9X3N686_9ACTN|nr:hypothetical protein [Solirubrobacter phytolaccae]MDA0179205.1 hypothetical protein [Solirubrobacter phytolaccae]